MNDRPSLRVILDEVGEPERTAVGRYAEELTKALIETAPRGVDVEGFSPNVDRERQQAVRDALPGLSDLQFATLPPRELRTAWLRTVTTVPMPGLVHATSLLAPFRSAEAAAETDQVVATVHGLGPLSDRNSRKAKWFSRALKRAHKHAAAIVVPTHAVAESLAGEHDFGDRVRVIGAGVPSGLRVPADADERAERLGLPERFVMTMTTVESRANARRIVDTIANAAMPEIPVVLVGPVGWGETTIAGLAVAAGLPASRILMLGELDDADLSVVYDRAALMLSPNPNDGFGLQLLESFSFGTPVVHAATPSLTEIAGGASIAVERSDEEEQPSRFAAAVGEALSDTSRLERLALLGRDRARTFSWQTTATDVWRLHAEL